jgi:hypothetical protein
MVLKAAIGKGNLMAQSGTTNIIIIIRWCDCFCHDVLILVISPAAEAFNRSTTGECIQYLGDLPRFILLGFG